ncbi:MAG: hypothetical protein AMJ81_06070 [Phycisphaerae bacterium SM23_33]|nr:MAG: hypothetical protein AMJ81_06070 [Phycisphaerae bacterium SM23_33]
MWGNWLGDPETRYGRRQRSLDVPMTIKMEMLNDPVIGWCLGFISAKLANARYEILCADEAKARFFQAMYDRVHHEFMLQAAPAVALGSLGLIKKFRFEVPTPQDPNDPPAWTGTAIPFILTGFDQIYPVGATPSFDSQTHEFTGIDHADGHVGAFYALWLTMGKGKAFGRYQGHGRLNYVYADWWLKQFGRDLYVVHLQKNIDRVVAVGYPPGQDNAGKDYRDHAIELGDSIRAGATVAIPSTVYEVVDQLTGETKKTNQAKWTLNFPAGAENVGAFHEMDDHLDQKLSLGLFVPPQVYLNVRQSALGGPTTAEVLGELAVDLLLLDAIDIDTHLNRYVFPIVERANFPADGPRVEKRTTGLVEKDKREIMEVVRALASKMDSEVGTVFDLRRALERVGLPVRSADGSTDEADGTDGGREEGGEEEVEVEGSIWLEMEGGHVAERIALRCPLCGYDEVDRYADHGGLCVCVGCGATFDPEVE